MNKTILAVVLAVAFGSAHATDVNSAASASVGSVSTSGVINNGFGYSSQSAGASAYNASGAWKSNSNDWFAGKAETGAYSEGSTYSYVKGVNVGSAFGTSGANAVQSGSAEASTGGSNLSGIYGANSAAAVGSQSSAANINNGFAKNGTTVEAGNESVGQIWKSGFKTKTFADTNGSTYNTSFGVESGAFGVTGGSATQRGSGFGYRW